jgi:chemotaxis protein MotA
MTKISEDEHAYIYVLRVVLISFVKGAAPIQALEFGRRAIPAHVRPEFNDMETSCKGGAAAAAGA